MNPPGSDSTPAAQPADLFPLLTLDQVRAAAPGQLRTLAIEIGREAATIAMLAAVALAVARNAGERADVFGVWDISFYTILKVLLDWPVSLSPGTS